MSTDRRAGAARGPLLAERDAESREKDSLIIEVEARDAVIGVVLAELPASGTLRATFRSARNAPVVRMSDVSPRQPRALVGETSLHALADGDTQLAGTEMFFPVVDLDLDDADEAVGVVTTSRRSVLHVNAWRFQEAIECDSEATIPWDVLGHWENWLRVRDPDSRRFEIDLVFALEASWNLNGCNSMFEIPILGSTWDGIVVVQVLGADGVARDEATTDISVRRLTAPITFPDRTGCQGSADEDLGALRGDLGQMLRFLSSARNLKRGDPLSGGLFLHYDHDALTWRMPNWIWTWGPAISAFLKGANEFEDDEILSAQLIAAAKSAGEASLTTALSAPSPAAGLINVRWHPRPHLCLGVDSFASPPDTLFLAGWGWIPMYEATGDGRYLAACQSAVNAVRDLTLKYDVIQQDWLGDSQRWKPYIVDEAGFGMEGLAAYFRITDDHEVRTIGRRYIDQILAKFERPDGLWDRFYQWETGERTPTERNTRGAAWAMEGLLAAHRLLNDQIYLDKAVRMADHLTKHQLADGAWSFHFDKSPQDVGITEKGTAAWSWLLFRLQQRTGSSVHLDAARRSLEWLRANMTRGQGDAIGGIAGCTPHSGVVYRPWFRISTTYTTSLACAAIMEDLKLRRAAEAR